MNDTLSQLCLWLAFEVGFLLLAASQFLYALVLRKLLGIIKKEGLWLLPLVGAVLTLGAIAVHLVAHVVYLPRLEDAVVMAQVEELARLAYGLRFSCFSLLFLSGLLTCVSGFVYMRWIRK